ncbi:MAG TPA: hypothetical protein VKA44_02480 [Gemmatimonadota bacterium]|nr:hypothetical protein [Gemmatimonadota bacterium]
MRRSTGGPRPPAALALALALAAASCHGGREGGSGGTFIRFRVEGSSYTVAGASLFVYPPSGGRRLVLLARSAFGPVPDASLGWRMPLPKVDDLVGREVELDHADFWRDEGARFGVTDDLEVGQIATSHVVLVVEAVRGGVAEGHFRGTGLELLDVAARRHAMTDVTGEFRARVVER